MTANDPLQRLRSQLVDAAERRATPSEQPAQASSRRRRRATWLAIGLAVIAVPAAAATTGILDLGSGSTPDGGSYTVTRTQDDLASGDPSHTDATGRTCESVTFRDKNGTPQAFGQNCRPRGSKLPDTVVSAGFDVTPGSGLLIRGTARDDVAKVTISGVSNPIALTDDPEGNVQRFNVVTTQDSHVISAYDATGRLLDQTSITPG